MFVPGAVHSGDGIPIGASVGKESHEVISSYNTWWDNIDERHGEKSSGTWFGMDKYAK